MLIWFSSCQQKTDSTQKKKRDITPIMTEYQVTADEDRGISYMIRLAQDTSGYQYTELLIHETIDGVQEEVFYHMDNALLTYKDQVTAIKKEIASRRKRWMQLCNNHRVRRLVEQLYTSDALYFNHKPMIKGTEALIKEYGYMNDEDYQLTLEPLKISVVNENAAFEIGQASGSYGGKYILIWERGDDGQWRIAVDSNV